jgi:molybdopterin-guanine dinucleotide biosynthesis protein A
MTELYGLLLAGGRSVRMQADKAGLSYSGRPQLTEAFGLLTRHVGRTWISVRADQVREPLRSAYPQVIDGPLGRGPIAGIIAAQAQLPHAAWLVVACDLPQLDGATLEDLKSRRDPRRLATAFLSAVDGMPEPLCAIYEPASRDAILAHVASGRDCPRKFLMTHDVALLDLARPSALVNVNTPQDAATARASLAARVAT